MIQPCDHHPLRPIRVWSVKYVVTIASYLDVANSDLFSRNMLSRDPLNAWLWLFREHLCVAKARGCGLVILREPWRWDRDETSAFAGPAQWGLARRNALSEALETIGLEGRPRPDLWHYGRLPQTALGPSGGHTVTLGDARVLRFVSDHFVGRTWDQSIGCTLSAQSFIDAGSPYFPTRLEPLPDKAYTQQHRYSIDVVDEAAMNPSPQQIIPDPAKLRVWQHKAHPETKAGTFELVRLCRAKGWEPCPTLWMFSRTDAEAITADELTA